MVSKKRSKYIWFGLQSFREENNIPGSPYPSLKTFQLQVGKRVEVVSVQRLKPAFTADDEAPAAPPRCGRPPRQPPPVPPDPPRCRGWPRKVVAASSAIALPKRKKVTFNLKPVIMNQSALTLKVFFIASAWSLSAGGNVEDDTWLHKHI